MNPTISTTDYEFAHGKRPRGKGGWGFRFFQRGIPVLTEFAVGDLTYSDARKWAIEKAKEISCEHIAVAT